MPILTTDEPGFIIHTNAYRENSYFLDLFTLNYGRIKGTVKVNMKGKHANAGLYQCFVPLKFKLVSTSSDVYRIAEAQMQRPAYVLENEYLFSAMYVNELIFNLIKTVDSAPEFFANYISTLEKLEKKEILSDTLREFERCLLANLGYSISFETVQGEAIIENYNYNYLVREGFIKSSNNGYLKFLGDDLIRLKHNDLSAESTRKVQKQLYSLIISDLLNGKTLKSRELYKNYLKVSD